MFSFLKILDALQYSSYKENVNYIFETYNDLTGGFAKWPNCSPDPLHTYMGLCGLSLVNYPFLACCIWQTVAAVLAKPTGGM